MVLFVCYGGLGGSFFGRYIRNVFGRLRECSISLVFFGGSVVFCSGF